MTERDSMFMQQALELAAEGLYTTMPNPRVGCVVVRDGEVVGRGAHLRAGEPHAEIHALRAAGALARQADVYITLEPCNHHGRTPPCSEALLAAGVRRVVVAMRDPNPAVAGSGLARLQQHGVEVACGVLEAQAKALNSGFVARMERGRPWLRSKIAASLDGRTALANGVSQWLTGEAARADVQHWRARSCAVLTGVGTVLQDDPQLTVRRADLLARKAGRQPLRVVLDSQLRTPPDARILAAGGVLLVHAGADEARAARLADAGAELMALPGDDGRVDLARLLVELGRREINELLVEAGASVNGSLQRQALIDEYVFYFAPLLLGNDARGMFELPALTTMAGRAQLRLVDTCQLGGDLRLCAVPVSRTPC